MATLVDTRFPTSIVGFDSAWTDNPKAPGALCIVRETSVGHWDMCEPQLVGFDQAADLIDHERTLARRCLVALDQPTIVPNATGCRPCERVAGSVISWIGGGVQPANRSRHSMFGDSAGLWRFKARLGASDDPEAARAACDGLFMIEVFPALALPAFDATFHTRLGRPRYNPRPRSRFVHADWLRVVSATAAFGTRLRVSSLDMWALVQLAIPVPTKADQDRLDSVICALVGLNWMTAARSESIVIGDVDTGYIVSPASPAMRDRLLTAAQRIGVPVDGT